MAASEPETVLMIGAEGGSFGITRHRGADGAWHFQATVNEMDYGLGPENPTGGGESSLEPSDVSSFAEALALLSRYPLPKLTPLRLLPDYEAEILEGLHRHPLCSAADIKRWKQRLMRLATPAQGASNWTRFEKALRIASIVHAGETRKHTAIPYISHVVHVARLLEQDGQPESVVLAGLLHDVLEDAKDTVGTREALASTFPTQAARFRDGDLHQELAVLIELVLDTEVLELVRAVTETKKESGHQRPWMVRKVEQLEHLSHASSAVAALKAADALHNACTILMDLATPGEQVFSRFNASVDETLWYYGTLAALTHEQLAGSRSRLGIELERVVERLTQTAARDTRDVFTGRRLSRPNVDEQMMAVLGPRGSLICGLDQWRRKAKPAKGDDHWKSGRSALELARAWTANVQPAAPRQLIDLLESHQSTRGLRLATAFAERETRLDAFGKGRQHDLVACGTVGDRRVLLAIEGKADESFGGRIGDVRRNALRKNELAASENRAPSRVPDRIERLSKLLWGRQADRPRDGLRYQLLYAVAGTLLEAKGLGASRAIFVVHEFVGPATRPTRVEANAADLQAFIQTLSKRDTPIAPPEQLAGPFFACGPDDELNRIELFVGKLRTSLDGPKVRVALSGRHAGVPG